MVDYGFDCELPDVEPGEASAEAASSSVAKTRWDDAGARQKSWLHRGKRTGKKFAGWRPRKLHRVATKKFLATTDNQIRVSTTRPGLKWWQYDASELQEQFRDWRCFPFIALGMDLGSDNVCGMFAGAYKFGLNWDGVPDNSHGCNKDIDGALRSCDLFDFWLLMVISWNLPFGWSNEPDTRCHGILLRKQYLRRFAFVYGRSSRT
jgi:hypothetical protein